MIPYIDAHCHIHGLPWNEWEVQGMTGMVGAVISAGNPHVYREILTEAPGPEDIRRLWEHPIRMAAVSEAKHLVRLGVGVAISAMTRVRDWERLIDELPRYLEREHVVAVGELGLDPVQYFGLVWPLEDQARCIRAQLEVAKAAGVPVFLHTPTPKEGKDFLGELGTSELPPRAAYRRTFMERDLEIVRAVGFPERRLVIDHTDASLIEAIHGKTEAYAGISIGSGLRPLDPAEVIGWIRRFGPGRILINSDHIPYRPYDVFAVPRLIREMRRAGLALDIIRRAVFDNANELYGLGL